MRRTVLLTIILSASIWQVTVLAAESAPPYSAVFSEANNLYASGNYCEAAQKYEELIESGLRHAPLFYNMGNACFKCGELGKAIMYYEKAWRVSPRDRDIVENLSFARLRVAEGEKEMGLLEVIISRTVFMFSMKELILLEELTIAILVLSGIMFLNSRRMSRKKIYRITAYTAGVLLLISLCLLSVRMIDERNTEGIVILERVDAMSGPGDDNIKVLSIPEGMKVWVDEERGDWYLIHLSTGRGGWVKKPSIGLI
jgi:tetratricopeptide (TPR) repeat protein